MFDILTYGQAIERMMREWYTYTQETLHQSTDLGFAREHFVKQVLESFLPKSVVVGSGEIIDGQGNRSGQQDVIIYRADFPVLTSLTPVNTYLIEGVIATIEIKSNLATGKPSGLLSAFKSVKKVRSLIENKSAVTLHGAPEQVKKLQHIHTVRTYIIGYAGWQNKKDLLKKFRIAGNETDWQGAPDLVCQPNACVLRNDGFVTGPHPIVDEKSVHFLFHQEYPLSIFLHHLMKSILMSTGGLIVTSPGIDAMLAYDLGPYFNFAPQAFEPLVTVQ